MYIKQKYPSVHDFWRGDGGVGRAGGQEGGGQWGGRISQVDMIECLCGHRL